jgi:CHAT domain-containing protein/tetratricopeptide (TPR) repeat protein
MKGRPLGGCALAAALILIVPGSGASTAQPPLATALAEVRELNTKGRFADSERRARELIAEAERQFGPDALETASLLDLLAESLQQAGKSRDPDARASVERALRIKEARLDPDDKEIAVSLTALGAVLINLGEYKTAQAVLQRALTIREKTLGLSDPLTAQTLGNLGTVTSEFLGDAAAGRPLLERALKASEAAYGPDHPNVGRILFNAARNAFRLDDLARARQYQERALSIFVNLYGQEHVMVGNTMTALAMTLQRQSEYAASQGRFEQGIAILEKSVGPDHEMVASAVNDFGLLLWQLGDYTAARSKYEQALGIWSSRNSAQAGAALNNLAILARRTGDYVEARGFYERSLVIKERVYGPDHVEVALVLHNLGNLLGDVGDVAQAQRLFERAIDIRTRRLGPSHSLVASSRYGLATMLKTAGLMDRAKPEFEHALAIWRQAAPESPDVAEGLRGLASLFEEMGQLRQAETRYSQALAIYEKTFGPEHIEVAAVLASLAALNARLGAPDRATSLARRALPIVESVLGSNSAQIARILALQADLQLDRGESAAAIELSLKSEAISREQFQLTARALSESQALGYADVRASGLQIALSALSRVGPDATARLRVHDALIRSRALVLDEVVSRHRPDGAEPAAADVDGRLAAARQRLANLLVRGPEGQPQLFRTVLDRARAEKDAAEEALATRSAPFRQARARATIGADAVRDGLPADAALISFVRYERKQSGQRTAEYAALVANAGRTEHAFVALGSATAVDVAIERWRAQIARPQPDRPGTSDESYRRVGAALRMLIWDPLRPSIADAAQVFVVPDGALNLVTFAALPAGDRYLAETGPLFHYLSTERDIVQAASREDGVGLLVIGNPSFDEGAPVGTSSRSVRGAGDPGCLDFDSVRFAPLPATGDEADAISDLWRRSAESGRSDGSIMRLTGRDAQESAFKRNASGSRVLHLATHGFVLGNDCVASSANQRGVGGLASVGGLPGRKRAARRDPNPLLLAGLAMAGANGRAATKPGVDDGILTAEEIVALDLRSVDLVVLSACDTGLGEVRAGEGVFGLRRAFQAAGARTLVMSLWGVDDRTARMWMQVFYERRLMAGASIAEAAHQASLAELSARRTARRSTHPFHWAGFVAAGDWR